MSLTKKDPILAKIEKAIKEVKPSISAHGGDLELISFKAGTATLKILGACLGCPMAAVTFGTELEEEIKSKVPEIKKIEFVS